MQLEQKKKKTKRRLKEILIKFIGAVLILKLICKQVEQYTGRSVKTRSELVLVLKELSP